MTLSYINISQRQMHFSMRAAPQIPAIACTIATGFLMKLAGLPVSAGASWARRWHIARTGNL